MKDQFDKEWFLPIKRCNDSVLNIICFPYGGGGASSFWSWKNLSIAANVFAIKLPGRDSRIATDPIDSASLLIDELISKLPKNCSKPMIFYGHSMGAGLAFQAIVELINRGRQPPIMLIASGREPPHIEYPNPIISMDDQNILEYIQSLGAVDEVIPKNAEFLKHYLPKIKADYTLNSSILVKSPEPLFLHISVINGIDDPLINKDIISQWGLHSNHSVIPIFMPGDHFFINRYTESFINTIAQQISRII